MRYGKRKRRKREEGEERNIDEMEKDLRKRKERQRVSERVLVKKIEYAPGSCAS